MDEAVIRFLNFSDTDMGNKKGKLDGTTCLMCTVFILSVKKQKNVGSKTEMEPKIEQCEMQCLTACSL